MGSDSEIPCAACLFWKPNKKSFACEPSKCKKLSKWLMKYVKDDASIAHKKMVEYIV
jgi:hypothetical protein